MTEDRSDAVRLWALGAFSGSAAWALILFTEITGMRFRWAFFYDGIEFSPISLFPGLVFGLVIGVFLHRRGKAERPRQVGYVAASGLAYFCAFHVAFHAHETIIPSLDSRDFFRMVISGILGGFVGSLLLGSMTMLLLWVPGRLFLQVPVGVGGAAGALLALTTDDRTKWGWTFLVFFMLWQGAYAASLAPSLRLSPPGSTSPP